MGPGPRLSVVVPVHNGGKYLDRCLSALRGSEFRDFELLVVNDSSSDNTEQIIAAWHDAQGLRTPRRLGPAGARNFGARAARGSIVVFVDADVQICPTTLGLIADDFMKNPDLAAVFGSYDQAPVEPGFFSQYKNLMHHYVHQDAEEQSGSFWAGCGAIRKQVLWDFGGFDERRYPRPAIEDIELGGRLRHAGMRVLLDKRIQVKHLKAWTLGGMVKSDIRDRAIPWCQLILQNGQMPCDLNLTYRSRFSAAATVLLVALALSCLQGSHMRGGLVFAITCGLAGLSLALVALNWDVYRFFRRQRGVVFMVKAVLIHWFYYFYSGITWTCCYTTYHLRRLLPSPVPAVQSTHLSRPQSCRSNAGPAADRIRS